MSTHRPLRHRPHDQPYALTVLAAMVQLSTTEIRQWWRALAAARWSIATDFRQRIQLFDTRKHSAWRVDQFIEQELRPHTLVLLIESLFLEGTLSRREATDLQERFLCCCNREGGWRD